MNFIAHYHFYKKDDAHYNLGLVLPDLVKNFCKLHLKPADSYVNRILNSLNEGSKIHLQGDKTFHNSESFKVCQDYISDLLDPFATWPRKWFLNHILTEILLDRVIMDRYSDEALNFYKQLESVDRSKVELYLKLSGIQSYQNFNPSFERFVSSRFIFEYLHNERIIYALGRLYSRVGIQYEWTENDKNLILFHLDKLLDFIDLQYDNFKLDLIH